MNISFTTHTEDRQNLWRTAPIGFYLDPKDKRACQAAQHITALDVHLDESVGTCDLEVCFGGLRLKLQFGFDFNDLERDPESFGLRLPACFDMDTKIGFDKVTRYGATKEVNPLVDYTIKDLAPLLAAIGQDSWEN